MTVKEYQDRGESPAWRKAKLEGRIARLLPLVADGDKVAARAVRAMRRELASLPCRKCGIVPPTGWCGHCFPMDIG